MDNTRTRYNHVQWGGYMLRRHFEMKCAQHDENIFFTAFTFQIQSKCILHQFGALGLMGIRLWKESSVLARQRSVKLEADFVGRWCEGCMVLLNGVSNSKACFAAKQTRV